MMLYIVRVYDDGEMFEYEYATLKHAEVHYTTETAADIIEYNQGKETILRRKIDGKECEVYDYVKEEKQRI